MTSFFPAKGILIHTGFLLLLLFFVLFFFIQKKFNILGQNESFLLHTLYWDMCSISQFGKFLILGKSFLTFLYVLLQNE